MFDPSGEERARIAKSAGEIARFEALLALEIVHGRWSRLSQLCANPEFREATMNKPNSKIAEMHAIAEDLQSVLDKLDALGLEIAALHVQAGLDELKNASEDSVPAAFLSPVARPIR